ncbi:MAG: flagellar biosynthetic protein FliR [Acetivibrionales bacterium]
MEYPLGLLLNGIEVFLLVFIRMTGLFVVTPIFGRGNIPGYLKIGFSFITALILINVVAMPEQDSYQNLYQYAFVAIKEFITGITLGFVAYLIFTGIYLAGQLIDMQIGFGMVNVLDPMSNIQIPVTANFYFIMSMLVFLSVNGHHLLIKGLFDSFELIPLGKAGFGEAVVSDIIGVFGSIFIIGFRIAAPVTAAILISDVALGIIARTVPQLNVFVVGMPLKIVVGIIIMMLTVPLFLMLLNAIMGTMDSEVTRFMRDLAPK